MFEYEIWKINFVKLFSTLNVIYFNFTILQTIKLRKSDTNWQLVKFSRFDFDIIISTALRNITSHYHVFHLLFTNDKLNVKWKTMAGYEIRSLPQKVNYCDGYFPLKIIIFYSFKGTRIICNAKFRQKWFNFTRRTACIKSIFMECSMQISSMWILYEVWT